MSRYNQIMIRRNFLVSLCSAICSVWVGNAQAATALKLAIAKDDPNGVVGTVLLPMFPLDMVAFPGQLVFLHIFEPRYRELIHDCETQRIKFGISALSHNQVATFGTEMQLMRILNTDEAGNMDIVVKGVRTFQLERLGSVTGKLYSGGVVRFQSNDPGIETSAQAELVSQFNQLQKIANTGQVLTGAIPSNLSFVIGHDVKLSRIQKLQLIGLPKEVERQIFLSRHLRHLLSNMQTVPQQSI